MLMRGKLGFDRYENGGCADCEDCNTCHFYRPHWKYQFCVYAECPYEPGLLTALRAARRSERKELITYSDIPRQLIEYSEDKNTGGQYHCKVSKQGHKSEWRTDRFYNTQYGEGLLRMHGIAPFGPKYRCILRCRPAGEILNGRITYEIAI